MKRLLQGFLLIFCLLLTLPCCAAKKHAGQKGNAPMEEHITWEDLDTALSQSKKDRKVVGLFFTGSDWCVWCKKMNEQILTSPDFIQFAQKYLHLVEIDFPQAETLPESVRERNEELKERYDVSGFPTFVFIRSDGTEIAKMGFEYGGGANYVKKVKAALSM